MNNSRCTVIYFDYGGCYIKSGDDGSSRWVSKEEAISMIAMKTSIEEVTYSELVDKLYRKIGVDKTMTDLKLSFISMFVEPKIPSYISDDEGVFCYLMDVNKDQRRSILHVELREGVEQSEHFDNLSRTDRRAEIAICNHSPLRINSSPPHIQGIAEFSSGEADSSAEISEHNEVLENVVSTNGEDVLVDNNDRYEDIEHNTDAEEDQYAIHAWEDGLDLEIGHEFVRKKELQDLVDKAAHHNCFGVATIKSCTKLYVVKCQQHTHGCRWSLRAAKIKNSDSFSIRTYNKTHTCFHAAASTSIKIVKGTPQLVASILHEDYPGQFETPKPKSLIALVQGKLGVKVSYSTALRGRKQAANDVRGSPEESFNMLHSYLYMLETLNHGTKTRVEVDEKKRFKYLFIALGACIEGFKFMRKVIIVDGTFIKSVYGGVLVVATAQDPDRHHYPIAFGVVDGEKDASWMWFMNMLTTVVPDDPELVFVSDRNASLIKAMREVYPSSSHGFCIYHLSNNVKTQVHYTKRVNKESIAAKFRECAQVYSEAELRKLYGKFRSRYPEAAEYLDKSVDERKWAKCFFLEKDTT